MAPAELAPFSLGEAAEAVAARLAAWDAAKVGARIWASDPTVWPKAPPPEVPERTGWLELPIRMRPRAAELAAFADGVRAEGTRHVVLLGMGGSSLAPDVLRRVFGGRPGYPELIVLDSTHPHAIRSVSERVDPARALFLVSSKSGTTTEPLDLLRFFWQQVQATGAVPGPHFVAVTDPGTPLGRQAHEMGFRAVFEALPTVGGRYSALTMFGLVPAALLGVDLDGLLERAAAMASRCGPEVPATDNPGLALGAALGELARLGRDKATIYASGSTAPFPVWAEQLIAESTGKSGRGIVPVVDEPPASEAVYGPDRLFVGLSDAGAADPLAPHLERLSAAGHPVLRFQVSDSLDIGAEFFRWELAVAAAGAILEIDPFDQPDVELAKQLAREAMAPGGKGGTTVPVPGVRGDDPRAVRDALDAWLRLVRPGDYVAVQAYLDPTTETVSALETVRARLLTRCRVATTVGIGPRFLHSTGQLHKGGANSGLFLQLVDTPRHDLPVPGAGYTFGELIRAQGLGDYRALQQRERRVLRVELGGDPSAALRVLEAAVSG